MIEMQKQIKMQKAKTNQKGQSTVEFSLTLLSLLTVVSLLTGLAPIAYNWLSLQYAATEASRFGSLGKIDPGIETREASIQNRVLDITGDLGLTNVGVEFEDESGAATAGAASEYFKMRVFRTIELQGLLKFFLEFAGFPAGSNPTYQVSAWTVIRNEPF